MTGFGASNCDSRRPVDDGGGGCSKRDRGPGQGALQLEALGATAWFEQAKRFADLSYRQCPAYAEVSAAITGSKAEFIFLTRPGVGVVGVGVVRVKKLPGLPFGVAYIHHGPLTIAGATFDAAVYSDCLVALASHYVDRRKLALRVIPPNAAILAGCNPDAVFGVAHFSKAAESPRRTIMLPIDGDIETLRKRLNQKWRNMLTRSEKVGLRIEMSESAEDLALMGPMLDSLEKRKSFHSARGVAFYARVQRAAFQDERMRVYLAYHCDRLVAGLLCANVGPIVELILAAANDEGRETKASHSMQWRVVQDALLEGKSWYDLGGIDPATNPGVYNFKKGVNGVDFTEAAVYERAPGKVVARGLRLAEALYRRIQR